MSLCCSSDTLEEARSGGGIDARVGHGRFEREATHNRVEVSRCLFIATARNRVAQY